MSLQLDDLGQGQLLIVVREWNDREYLERLLPQPVAQVVHELGRRRLDLLDYQGEDVHCYLFHVGLENCAIEGQVLHQLEKFVQ